MAFSRHGMAFSRRDALKAGLVAAGAAFASRARGDGGDNTLVSSSGLKSPSVTPWVEPLFIPPVLTPTALSPAFQVNEPARGGVAPYVHQRYAEFPAKKTYQLNVQNTDWSFHRELPLAPLYTYGGSAPGPLIQARYGEPIIVRINNQLENFQSGFGFPDTATHLHNFHTPAESDGYPGDFVTPGNYRDQHYPMARAGYDQSPATNGDVRESMGTLWYHDHRIDHTAENVYRGLFGFFNAFDELDTGDENDTSPSALRLPSGPYDIMLNFVDPQFDGSGLIFFDVFDNDGHLGDKVAVNGKIQPFLNVERRKYRFRLLDVGPSRFYQFYLSKGLPVARQNSWLPMTLIANDGNLLEAPVTVDNVLMGVANREDVIVDFSNFNDKDEIYLVDRLPQTSGRGPDFDNLMDPGVPVLKFIVQGTSKAADPSVVPNFLRPLPRPTAAELASAVRATFVMNRSKGAWQVNDRFFDLNVLNTIVKRGSTQIWTLQNGGGGWSHPVHSHFEECQILSRTKSPQLPTDLGRKDVVILRPDESATVFFRFRDFLGHYVQHCHNVVHEDHAMMARFDVVP
jgi:FtsP/CotA-like multicopper oxidase with cupredoxin domain